MDSSWEKYFIQKFTSLKQEVAQPGKTVPLSIKVRVANGCFHREHSPRAYEIIDEVLRNTDLAAENARFEEHESGPEILLWLAVAGGTLNLAASVVNMVTAIIRARTEGIRNGDTRDSPLEVIVRGVDTGDKYVEKEVMHIRSQTSIEDSAIEAALDQAIAELFGNPNR